jgi:oligopeptide/dipeptide ABC transporter ATP-binding protein
VVGESGCGKSTLARAILGLVPTAGGVVELDGAPAEQRALRRRVQMVFQDPYQTLNPRMRVRAIVEEPLVISGGGDRDRVERALDDVGLPPGRFADRFPHELSGGQRQRVAIAAALVLDPDALICDEPVSMLDVSVRAQVLKVLMDLRESRSLALLFITHDLGLAWTLCDRIAVMYLGRIVEQGSAAQVIEQPRHPYTQALVAAVPSPGREAGAKLLAGEPPDAAHIPPGCRLHPRCPHRFEPCDSEDPPLFGEGEHRAACLLLRDGNINGAG